MENELETPVESGPVTLSPPRRKRNCSNTVEAIDTQEEVESEAPEQSARYKWEFVGRQHPRWGEITREGLVVGRGEKQKVVPPDEVWKLAGMGCSMQEIADWFQVDRETIKYNFHEYIAKAREEMKQRLRMAQIKTAIGGNCTMLIWLGKQYLGQVDSPVNTEEKQPLPWSDE